MPGINWACLTHEGSDVENCAELTDIASFFSFLFTVCVRLSIKILQINLGTDFLSHGHLMDNNVKSFMHI